MRLAVLSSHPIQYYGPLFRTLAKTLDLEVLFAHHASPEQQAKAGFGTAFEWDNDPTSGYRHRYLNNVSSKPGVDHFAGCDTPGVGKVLDEGRFDAVLTMGWHLKSSVQGILAARRRGLPVIVRGDSQLSTPRSPLKRWAKAALYPPLLRQFSAACYVGERSKAYYQHFHFPEERLFFSPHCIDNQWFEERATPAARAARREALGVGDHQKLVLFAGKLVPFKRPLDLVDTIAQARRNGLDAAVLVAGSGALEEAMTPRAAELDVPLHKLGFQNQSQMPSAYAAADVLMLPSDGSETWGLVCNEALASGTPILVSSQVGCADNLATGVAGSVYPVGDINAAALALADLVRQPPSKAAIASVAQAHSLEAAAQGIARAVHWVVSKGSDRSRMGGQQQTKALR